MRRVKIISKNELKKDINLLLKLLLTHKKVAVVHENKIRFVAMNPNRKEITQELFG